MTRVVLIRHGATAANKVVPYRLQGRGSNLPLDDLGREQSERTARVLAELAVDAVYSSPLLRALETARIVARPHRLDPLEVPELTEADTGRWEGLTWGQAEARDPEHHHRFHANPGTVPYLDGESFLDVQRRTVPAIAALAAKHPDQRIIVVAHHVVNRAYLAAVLGIPIDRARTLRQANGGISIIDYQGETPTLKTMNASLHLEGVETI
jgi:broad specificity phosphatase PhoE